ncbi:MAG: DedA family protein [Corynebacterium pyruviciproducens]|uniref:DedA family protein n=1 Tax=Corynebacterium pyruviciproducens TaxID=598660 RepID=UPI003983874E
MIDAITSWVTSLMETLGAPGVGIAIFLESAFPPIPSEVVLPLAGFTASQGSMGLVAAIVWATVGSLLGAYLLYFVGHLVGADRLRKIADWLWLVEAADVDKSMAWFDKYGSPSVFFGRMVPGIRSLISIPAGIDRMGLVKFTLWTTLGSAIWNSILVYLGFTLGENWHTVTDYMEEFSLIIKILLVIAFVALTIWLMRLQRKSSKK